MYTKQSKFVRNEALKAAMSMASLNLTMNGLTAMAGGKVTYDLLNSDFAKNRFGNTRVDFGAGMIQPLVFASRMIRGAQTSSTTGKTSELGSGYGQTGYGDLVWRFLTSKESPLMGAISDVWTGKDWQGEDKNRAKAIMERFTPMIAQDLADLVQDDPRLAGLIIPGFFGASVQTYDNPKHTSGLRRPGMGIRMPRP
jgi:hypothetical protein